MVNWKKIIRFITGILLIALLIYTLEGGWAWIGVGSILLASFIIAGIKMYRSRKAIKLILEMAGNKGAADRISHIQNKQKDR